MLSALAGGDALEILVLLKDMSEAGLKNLERNIAHAEQRANATNFSGFSRSSKTLAKDAEKAAGKEIKGGGGLGGMIAGFTGLPLPVLAAGAALAGFAAISAGTIPVYENYEKQEKALTIAAKDHKIAIEDLEEVVAASIPVGEKYAYTASDTRQAILKLVEANVSLKNIQTALPLIMDLARAKNIDLAEATRLYTLALNGNARGLKDLGIVLPKLSTSVLSLKDAKLKAKDAALGLKEAQQHLNDVQSKGVTGQWKLNASTRVLTYVTSGHKATALELEKAHLAVTKAQEKNRSAQAALTAAQHPGAAAAQRLLTLNKDLAGAIGDQKSAITPLQVAQTKLSDAWERFAIKVGPGVADILTGAVGLFTNLVDMAGPILDFVGHLHTGLDAIVATVRTLLGLTGGATHVSGVIPTKGNTPGKAPGPPTHHRIGQAGASGGLRGEHGEEWVRIGEHEPEYIVPQSRMGAGGGVHLHVHSIWPPTPQQIRAMADALDHQDYWSGLGAASTGNRT